jgi:hypothetical protein
MLYSCFFRIHLQAEVRFRPSAGILEIYDAIPAYPNSKFGVAEHACMHVCIERPLRPQVFTQYLRTT